MKHRRVEHRRHPGIPRFYTRKRILPQILLYIAGTLLICDTLFVISFSNFNLGVILPAILGLPLLLCGIFYQKIIRSLPFSRFLRFLRVFLITGYTVFLVVVIITGSILVIFSASKPEAGADAIIVLGAGIHGDQVTRLLAKRLRAAIEYKQENPGALIVVSGGQGQGEDITEAEAMERFLILNGISKEDIIKEEASTSTQENFRFSKLLLDEHFPDGYSVVYVTNDFHIFRAGLVAKKEGLTADGLTSMGTEWYVLPNCYLREIAAVWVYFLLGRF